MITKYVKNFCMDSNTSADEIFKNRWWEKNGLVDAARVMMLKPQNEFVASMLKDISKHQDLIPSIAPVPTLTPETSSGIIDEIVTFDLFKTAFNIHLELLNVMIEIYPALLKKTNNNPETTMFTFYNSEKPFCFGMPSGWDIYVAPRISSNPKPTTLDKTILGAKKPPPDYEEKLVDVLLPEPAHTYGIQVMSEKLEKALREHADETESYPQNVSKMIKLSEQVSDTPYMINFNTTNFKTMIKIVEELNSMVDDDDGSIVFRTYGSDYVMSMGTDKNFWLHMAPRMEER